MIILNCIFLKLLSIVAVALARPEAGYNYNRPSSSFGGNNLIGGGSSGFGQSSGGGGGGFVSSQNSGFGHVHGGSKCKRF